MKFRVVPRVPLRVLRHPITADRGDHHARPGQLDRPGARSPHGSHCAHRARYPRRHVAARYSERITPWLPPQAGRHGFRPGGEPGRAGLACFRYQALLGTVAAAPGRRRPAHPPHRASTASRAPPGREVSKTRGPGADQAAAGGRPRAIATRSLQVAVRPEAGIA